MTTKEGIKMINNFKDGVFNELYDIRSEDYELCFSEKLTKETEKFEVSEKREKLKIFINELNLEDDTKIKQINDLIKDLENALFLEMDYWCRKYYKLGFCDAEMLKKETKTFSEKNRMKGKSFYNECSDEFLEYVEEYRVTYLMKKPEYKELINQVRKLKEDNPKVENLVEDGKIEILNYKELKVIQKLLSLGSQLDFIEQKEIFRLGMREMLTNLADMNLISLNLK